MSKIAARKQRIKSKNTRGFRGFRFCGSMNGLPAAVIGLPAGILREGGVIPGLFYLPNLFL